MSGYHDRKGRAVKPVRGQDICIMNRVRRSVCSQVCLGTSVLYSNSVEGLSRHGQKSRRNKAARSQGGYMHLASRFQCIPLASPTPSQSIHLRVATRLLSIQAIGDLPGLPRPLLLCVDATGNANAFATRFTTPERVPVQPNSSGIWQFSACILPRPITTCPSHRTPLHLYRVRVALALFDT